MAEVNYAASDRTAGASNLALQDGTATSIAELTRLARLPGNSSASLPPPETPAGTSPPAYFYVPVSPSSREPAREQQWLRHKGNYSPRARWKRS